MRYLIILCLGLCLIGCEMANTNVTPESETLEGDTLVSAPQVEQTRVALNIAQWRNELEGARVGDYFVLQYIGESEEGLANIGLVKLIVEKEETLVEPVEEKVEE